MRIALIGYGKMGRMVESLAAEAGIEVAGVVDSPSDALPDNFEVAIDFSEPDAVVRNVRRAAEAQVAIVVGTTGWAAKMPEVEGIVRESGIGLVHSANFSVGVNLFFKLAERAAELLRERHEYEAWAYEVHHSAKKDAPSGTLLQIVKTMRGAGYEGRIDVASNRVGKVPGTHEVGFDSSADTITLTHAARTREGFARGALLAARLILGRQGVHTFAELL